MFNRYKEWKITEVPEGSEDSYGGFTADEVKRYCRWMVFEDTIRWALWRFNRWMWSHIYGPVKDFFGISRNETNDDIDD